MSLAPLLYRADHFYKTGSSPGLRSSTFPPSRFPSGIWRVSLSQWRDRAGFTPASLLIFLRTCFMLYLELWINYTLILYILQILFISAHICQNLNLTPPPRKIKKLISLCMDFFFHSFKSSVPFFSHTGYNNTQMSLSKRLFNHRMERMLLPGMKSLLMR